MLIGAYGPGTLIGGYGPGILYCGLIGGLAGWVLHLSRRLKELEATRETAASTGRYTQPDPSADDPEVAPSTATTVVADVAATDTAGSVKRDAGFAGPSPAQRRRVGAKAAVRPIPRGSSSRSSERVVHNRQRPGESRCRGRSLRRRILHQVRHRPRAVHVARVGTPRRIGAVRRRHARCGLAAARAERDLCGESPGWRPRHPLSHDLRRVRVLRASAGDGCLRGHGGRHGGGGPPRGDPELPYAHRAGGRRGIPRAPARRHGDRGITLRCSATTRC